MTKNVISELQKAARKLKNPKSYSLYAISRVVSATYTGPLVHLHGKTALTRHDPTTGGVFAQFDDKSLTRDGRPIPQQLEYEPHARFPTWADLDTPPPQALGFGWHQFAAEDFKVAQ